MASRLSLARSRHPAAGRRAAECRPGRPSRRGARAPTASRPIAPASGGIGDERVGPERLARCDPAYSTRAVADEQRRTAAASRPACEHRRRIADASPRSTSHQTRRLEWRRVASTRYSAVNTSRRCASIHAATRAPARRRSARQRARARRAPTRRRSRRRVTNASPCIVAMPMRRPVNDPGPDATANRSIADSGDVVRVEQRRGARPAAARRASASRVAARARRDDRDVRPSTTRRRFQRARRRVQSAKVSYACD